MTVAGPEGHWSLCVQTAGTLRHVLVLYVGLQTLDHSPLRAFIALLRALGPLGGVPLWCALGHIHQDTWGGLRRLITGTLSLVDDRLLSDAENESHFGQVETISGAGTPGPREPVPDHALLLAAALAADVWSEPLVTAIRVRRGSVAEDGPVLHTCATLGATLVHPLGHEPGAGLLWSPMDRTVLAARWVAND